MAGPAAWRHGRPGSEGGDRGDHTQQDQARGARDTGRSRTGGDGTDRGGGPGGGGLIGWTPLPAGFVTGNPSADLRTQLAALPTYNEQWSQYLPALNAATSAASAAYIQIADFERPGIPAAANREAAATAVAQACGQFAPVGAADRVPPAAVMAHDHGDKGMLAPHRNTTIMCWSRQKVRFAGMGTVGALLRACEGPETGRRSRRSTAIRAKNDGRAGITRDSGPPAELVHRKRWFTGDVLILLG
jgi:hypothetical protein